MCIMICLNCFKNSLGKKISSVESNPGAQISLQPLPQLELPNDEWLELILEPLLDWPGSELAKPPDVGHGKKENYSQENNSSSSSQISPTLKR